MVAIPGTAGACVRYDVSVSTADPTFAKVAFRFVPPVANDGCNRFNGETLLERGAQGMWKIVEEASEWVECSKAAPAVYRDLFGVTRCATTLPIYTPPPVSGPALSGSCFTGSLADGRRDAWRCTAGDAILDPCFETATAGTLVCASSPWNSHVAVLQLTKPLQRSRANKTGEPPLPGLPWAIETADGLRCTLLTGTHESVHGISTSYGCVGGGAYLGAPNRSKQQWTIGVVPLRADAPVRVARITSAWW